MNRFDLSPVNLTKAPGLVGALLLLAVLSGCATTGGADSRDPLEGINRSVYGFNTFMDDNLIHPIGQAYRAVLPDVFDRGISNMFSNINEIAVIANDLLQFKFNRAGSDLARLLVNSTLGVFGFFDVATGTGLPKHNEDLGQTLGVWGIGTGPYLVAPFLGPTTLRDAAGFTVETTFLNPVSYVQTDAYRAGLLALNYIDYRSDYEGAQRIVDEAALDEYEFTKNAFLQRRENLVQDREVSTLEKPD